MAQTARYHLVHSLGRTEFAGANFVPIYSVIRKKDTRTLEEWEERKKANPKVFITVWNNGKMEKNRLLTKRPIRTKGSNEQRANEGGKRKSLTENV